MRGSRIGLLGAAYKPDVGDPRESPTFRIMELLQEQGAVLSYNDPHVPELPSMRHFLVPQLASQPLTADYLESLDCAVICTDHSAYDFKFIAEHAPRVVDTRNAMSRAGASGDHIYKA